ncbi:MAG: patatin-like phospholipase family protein, partial [candidate division Zixibacteria bacterium]
LIVGTSMGAVIGGMYAQLGDIGRVEEKVISYIESFGVKGKWLSFLGEPHVKDQRDLFGDIAYYIKKQYIGIRTLTNVALEEKEILYEPLKAFLEDDRIENCKIPFAAVAMDLRYGKTEVLTSGPIIDAVYASAAVEGAFPPIEQDGMILADGGPVAIVPVEIARKMGAKKIIAVDVSIEIKEEEKCSSGLQVILRADTIAQDRLRMIDLGLADLVISPKITAVHWANFSRVKYSIRRGEIAARASLDKMKDLVSSKPWWKRVLTGSG